MEELYIPQKEIDEVVEKVNESVATTLARCPPEQVTPYLKELAISGYYEVAIHTMELYANAMMRTVMTSITKE